MNYLEDERLGVRSQMLYRLPQAKLSNLYFESLAKERDGKATVAMFSVCCYQQSK